MKWLTILLQLLQSAVRLFERKQRDKEQVEHEEQKRKAQDDPAGWFDDYFNGDPNRVRTPAADNRPAELPDDADEAGQAAAAKPDENR